MTTPTVRFLGIYRVVSIIKSSVNARERMPFALLHAALDMASIVVRRLWFFGLVPPPIAGQAGCNDVVGTIQSAFAACGQMFSRAFQGQSKSTGQAIANNKQIEIIIPHHNIAVIASPVLMMSGNELEGFSAFGHGARLCFVEETDVHPSITMAPRLGR
jgi:hypothetical protein